MKSANNSSDQRLDEELSAEELSLVQGGSVLPQHIHIGSSNPVLIIDSFGGSDPFPFGQPFNVDPLPFPVDPSPTFPVDPSPFPGDPFPGIPESVFPIDFPCGG